MWFAVVAGAAVIALYGWGMLFVSAAVLDAEDGGADSSPIRPCRTPGWEVRDIVDYRVDYLPIRFVCETSDGESYATDAVPDYVNPALSGLTVVAVGFGVRAAVGAELRARSTYAKERARSRTP
ncbi:hypothetical protein GT354_11810 [Streptomyces sp. SID3343]|nr:hypothetical protein [Streptomyces sp. SID3343]MYV98959.1 hypothetical protein [Streptomyces sp. SID3343]